MGERQRAIVNWAHRPQMLSRTWRAPDPKSLDIHVAALPDLGVSNEALPHMG
ncbi:hypothetical protein [Mesorhizobium sp.]|uniref:hypothetical protein n=1 Tax=Mesorhizobium sp. TaxID=1871066 RepID=UPI0025F2E25C|nr:hypothetical protein [Mesorhizobium sp.]